MAPRRAPGWAAARRAVDVLGGEGARPGRWRRRSGAAPGSPGPRPAARAATEAGRRECTSCGAAGGGRRPFRKRRMGRVEDHQRSTRSGCRMASSQASSPPQSCPATAAGRRQGADQVGHVLGQPWPVVAHPGRLVGEVVAAQVGGDHPVAGRGERGIWCRQAYQNSGKPCSRTTRGPAPASTQCRRSPPTSIHGGPCPWRFPFSSRYMDDHPNAPSRSAIKPSTETLIE